MPMLEEQLFVNQRLLSLTQDGASFQHRRHELQLDKLTSEAQEVGSEIMPGACANVAFLNTMFICRTAWTCGKLWQLRTTTSIA